MKKKFGIENICQIIWLHFWKMQMTSPGKQQEPATLCFYMLDGVSACGGDVNLNEKFRLNVLINRYLVLQD